LIHGIGVDLVCIDRIRRAMDRFGERFSGRILSHQELDEFSHSSMPARFLASRFAAKEACAKALGTGFRGGLSLRHIGVAHDAYGKPILVCGGKAEDLFQDLGITISHISLSDEQGHAIAFVVLEKQQAGN